MSTISLKWWWLENVSWQFWCVVFHEKRQEIWNLPHAILYFTPFAFDFWCWKMGLYELCRGSNFFAAFCAALVLRGHGDCKLVVLRCCPPWQVGTSRKEVKFSAPWCFWFFLFFWRWKMRWLYIARGGSNFCGAFVQQWCYPDHVCWVTIILWLKSVKGLCRFKWAHWGNKVFENKRAENVRFLGGGFKARYIS